MTLRIFAAAPVALVAIAGSLAQRAMADCPPGNTFTFQVERPGGVPAKSVQLAVEFAGASGSLREPVLVYDTGNAKVCLRGAKSGEMVNVYAASPTVRVLYPSRGRMPLSRNEPTPIVVCEASHDCALRSEAEILGLILKLQTQIRSMTSADRVATLREQKEWIRQVSRDTNADNEKLITALFRKERQIKAASQASTLLRTFVNRAREVLERFDRHAERVLANRSRREADEMNKAYGEYNPVFNEMSEKADAYLMETADYWSSEVSSELRALIDEALAIHRQGIYPLNAASTIINDCIKKRRGPACPGLDAARTAVQAARRTTREVTLTRLDRFEKNANKWLDALDEQLFVPGK